MTVPHFRGVVRYRNELLLPPGLYPAIDAPDRVPVWDPFLASSWEMLWVQESGRRARDLHDRRPEDLQNLTDCFDR